MGVVQTWRAGSVGVARHYLMSFLMERNLNYQLEDDEDEPATTGSKVSKVDNRRR